MYDDTASPELIAGDVVVTVPYRIDRQRLSDLLCTAVEGGTGYWAHVDQMVRTPNLDYVSVRFTEEEASSDDTPKSVVITLDEMAKGVRRCALSQTYAHHFRDFITDNADATTADVIVQFAMFDEVIYG